MRILLGGLASSSKLFRAPPGGLDVKQTLLHDHAVKDLVKKTLDPDFEKLGSGYLCGVELWFKSTLVRPDLEFFLLHIIYQYKFYPLISMYCINDSI